MIVEKRTLEDCTLLNVEGVIRLGESAAFFAETLERSLQDGSGDVLVDLSRINHMDSTGLGELIGYLRRFRDQHRRLLLINPSEPIRDLLRVARLDEQFSTYQSVDEALGDRPGH